MRERSFPPAKRARGNSASGAYHPHRKLAITNLWQYHTIPPILCQALFLQDFKVSFRLPITPLTPAELADENPLSLFNQINGGEKSFSVRFFAGAQHSEGREPPSAVWSKGYLADKKLLRLGKPVLLARRFRCSFPAGSGCADRRSRDLIRHHLFCFTSKPILRS